MDELINKLPENYIELEPETIREIYKGDSLKAEKVLALIVSCSTDIPFQDLVAFNAVVVALNDIPFDPDIFYNLELKHIEKAFDTISKYCKKKDKVIELGPEVLEYIAKLALDENIHYFPRGFHLAVVNDLIKKKDITEEQKELWSRLKLDDPYVRKIVTIQQYTYNTYR